jgi:hypothetical protein
LVVGRLPLGGGNSTAPDIVRAIHAVKGDKFCTGTSSGDNGKASWTAQLAGPVKSNDARWRAACFLTPRSGTTATATFLSCVVVDGGTLEVSVDENARALHDGESPAHFDCGGDGIRASWLKGAPIGLGVLFLAVTGWFAARLLLRSRASSVPA